MYMLIEVGSENIHYSLVPYLLPSQSLKPAPQSQTFIEYRTILIRHYLSQAIGCQPCGHLCSTVCFDFWMAKYLWTSSVNCAVYQLTSSPAFTATAISNTTREKTVFPGDLKINWGTAHYSFLKHLVNINLDNEGRRDSHILHTEWACQKFYGEWRNLCP